MSSQSHRPIPAHSDEGEEHTQAAPAVEQQELAEISTVQRGGGSYLVERGDTLSAISRTTYGSSAFWEDIAAANPDRVGLGGDLIYTGSELVLPVLTVPAEGAPPAQEAHPVAVQPREESTPYGEFLVYEDAFVGLLPQEEGWVVLRESDYIAEVERRRLAAEANKEQAIASLNDLLPEGGFFSFTVTDSEALTALAILGALPLPQRQAAVAAIGPARVGVLIDNLPSSAIETAEFTRVVVALGPEAVQQQIHELFSPFYFKFIDPDELVVVTSMISWLPQATQQTVFENCGTEGLIKLVKMLPEGSALTDDQRFLLGNIFDWASDSDMKLLGVCFEKRWDLTIDELPEIDDEDVSLAWDASGLRRSWAVFAALPAGHVEGNPVLALYARYGTREEDGTVSKAGGAGGYYADWEHLVAMNYDEQHIEVANTWTDPQDALYGVNRFDAVVRHEIGHAVDEKIGATDKLCKTSTGGDWEDYLPVETVADAWLNSLPGVLSSQEGEVGSAIRVALIKALTDSSAREFRDLLVLNDTLIDLEGNPQEIVERDPVYKALRMALNEPWEYHSDEDGGVITDGKIYQQSYRKNLTSYDVSARDKKVSTYQFRSPYEWFAEAYTAFYEPVEAGEEEGQLLKDADEAAFNWFKTHVVNA
ncbi:MAG: LysM domain-containing protein [Myxococcota bacterium]|nr:LysM domain-containing protein [Myxococcota bacterium]